jgi:hypothetical protein
MTRVYRYSLMVILIGTALACGVISNPLSGAKGLASTAEAIASAIPSGLPDVTQYLNPQGAPVSEWNGIPIMTQATAGQEFNKSTYSYRASGVAESDVEAFYKDKLTAAGWTTPFSAQGGSSGGLMLFTKETSVLTITVTKADQDLVILLSLQ